MQTVCVCVCVSTDDLPPLHGKHPSVRVALLVPLLCTSRLAAPNGVVQCTCVCGAVDIV